MDTTQNFNMENNTLNQNFVINPMLFQHQTNINMNANNNLMNQNLLYNQMIQNMLNSGRISQQQYDAAVKQAQQIQQMLAPGGRR
jgi:hypothetical protein